VAGPDGLLLLDKAPGYSSTQALARAKRMLGARKAGHTGTLDPFATGLLPIAFGEATKFSRFLIDSAKSYRATLELGSESTTGDTEGVISTSGSLLPDECRIDEVVASFAGVQDQIPPMHSAIHVGGKRLYDLAREGIEVVRAPRRIDIAEIRRLSFEGRQLVLAVTCSKGTYIRSLAMDIGRALGCGAYLTGLRRTASGAFGIDGAATLELLEREGVDASRQRLLPVEAMVSGLPRCELGADDAEHLLQGRRIVSGQWLAGTHLALFGPGGRFLGVGLTGDGGGVEPLRLMATGACPKPPDFA
jgi:tRNA pseudouridine55 synthase